MTLAIFFEKFDLLAGAPDAVMRMRDLVLQLAVRGQLVAQDPEEPDADALLETIARGRTKVGEEGATMVPDSEIWHAIPANWRWVRLRALGHIVGGGTPRSDNAAYFAQDGIPWLTPADLNGYKHKRIFRGRRFITQAGLENSSARLLPEGSVLFSSRAPIGYVAIAGIELATNQGFKSCVPYIREIGEYLFYALKSASERVDREASGTTFREVSGRVVGQIPIPLPPLAEQKRIVARIDELMALCDRLEAQQQERETKHVALAGASLARFADAPTPANLEFLFHRSYNVSPSELRKTILTLAVGGKLVVHDPSEEDVDGLLAANDANRREMARTDRRSDVECQTLLSGEDRWEVPATWAWRALADVALFVDYRGKTPTKTISGIPLITAKNVRKGRVASSPQEFISDEDYHRWMRRGIPRAGDVLFTTEAPMGNAAVVDADEQFALAQRVICFQSYGALESAFLVIQILSDGFQFILEKNATGVTAKGIKAAKLKRLPVAVPPRMEQRRIVGKVNELMAMVDRLEFQMDASREVAANLVDAVVSELTGLGARRMLDPVSRELTLAGA